MSIKRNTEQEAQIKQDLRNIVNEAFAEKNAPDLTQKFTIDRFIQGLLAESKNPKMTSYLLRYEENVNKGIPQFLLYENFAQGLQQFTAGNKAVQSVIETVNQTLRENANLLEALKIVADVEDEIVYDDLMEHINRFFDAPNDMTRDLLLESIDNLNNIQEFDKAGRLSMIVNGLVESEPAQF